MLQNLDLQKFSATVNTTENDSTGNYIASVEMKTYYDKDLIRNATPLLVHDQFGQKRAIPKGSGKKIEFRKLNPFAVATSPISEGVTPDGKKLDWTKLEATAYQYGDYVTVTDLLDLTAIDSVVIEANRILGDQAGRTLDTITKEVINAGTNVQYANGTRLSRATITSSDLLTVAAVKKAVTTLKNGLAKRINGSYIGIIHPNVVNDLTNDPNWQAVKDYDPKDWYEGEIGRIFGVRFIETTDAKIFLSSGASGINVYSTLIIGADAYGVTEIEGGGLQTIIKQLGSGGSEDPLNQRATIGWKATKTAKILTNAFMVRIETAATE